MSIGAGGGDFVPPDCVVISGCSFPTIKSTVERSVQQFLEKDLAQGRGTNWLLPAPGPRCSPCVQQHGFACPMSSKRQFWCARAQCRTCSWNFVLFMRRLHAGGDPFAHEPSKFHSGVPKVLQKIMHLFPSVFQHRSCKRSGQHRSFPPV